IRRHRRHVVTFLNVLGLPGEDDEIASLSAPQIFRFVRERAEELSRWERKSMCTVLRSFLRFLHLRGYVPHDLAEAVPVIPNFSLDRLPRPIAREDIEKVLRAVDRTTPIGRRDYAILLILGTYGLRGGQICALRLEDFDWPRETIRVCAVKSGRDVRLPLVCAVGEALVDYLRHGRPAAPSREIFLRVNPPVGPLRCIYHVVRKHVRKAGLTNIPMGPHAWRHGLASRLLANGNALKTIGDVLGHRSVESTLIYTKIDIETLRQAALEWPGARP
ncbi:site-specific integrase, partial [Planctomycetota bacterium]